MILVIILTIILILVYRYLYHCSLQNRLYDEQDIERMEKEQMNLSKRLMECVTCKRMEECTRYDNPNELEDETGHCTRYVGWDE